MNRSSFLLGQAGPDPVGANRQGRPREYRPARATMPAVTQLLLSAALAVGVALSPPTAWAAYVVTTFTNDEGLTCIAHGDEQRRTLACGVELPERPFFRVEYLCRFEGGALLFCQNRDGSPRQGPALAAAPSP
jgi:hypothetical protein